MTEEYDYESLGGNATLTQDAMAGALAGIAEHCAMYPVDSIKTRMQVIQTVPINTSNTTRPQLFSTGNTPTGATSTATAAAAHHSKHLRHVHSAAIVDATTEASFKGLKSASRNLWRGVNSVVMGAGPAHALHFATYEACKESFGSNHLLSNAAAGACATLAHDTLMNPFDVIKQRMQLGDSTYRTVRECARHVYAKEGFAAFYISLPTTLTMSIPFQSIQFATYEYFRKALNPSGDYDPKTHAIAGGLAGAIASSLTTPLDVVKTLLQTRGSNSDPRIRNASGLMDAVNIIKERYGVRGFFRGFRPRMLTHMPSAAISWSVYEYFKWFISRTNNTAIEDKNILRL
ncbi:putative mitochondrial carrier C8C9.12c [Choanephora cucurbitarum]|uniref:Putative mitochondrial carrier C8C9.12c n=1 Tax=Choanephora cucurbitarum TaxID=101091 RepID=A0A1C7N7F5_9FUNG|nr:putative mitochondrial carrier C8C9.12c [Choanephora cucurbitarum]